MEKKRFSVSRQADLRAMKHITPAQGVCSENHCGVAGDEWVVFMASGSFLRERLSWKMILATVVGKSDSTQRPPPTSLLAWGMMAGLGLDFWDIPYKDEKNHLPHSFLLFEMKICPSRRGFLYMESFADPEKRACKMLAFPVEVRNCHWQNGTWFFTST